MNWISRRIHVGSLSTYLVPLTPQLDPGAYLNRVKAALLSLEVIVGERYHYAEQPNWLCAGPKSLEPFENEAEDEIGFEYCILYGEKRVLIVPQDPAVEPSCPTCGADVSNDYYELVNSIEDTQTKDYEGARLRCHSCGHSSRFDQLKDRVGVFLTNTFINFEDASGPLKARWLKQFEKECGIKHRLLEYGYT
jgi:hypothetical protein